MRVDYLPAFSISQETDLQTLVFGKVFLSGNGDCYICPQYITDYVLQNEYEVPTNAPGIKVELPADATSPQSGDTALCVGVLDSNSWCMSSHEFISGDIEWLTGEIEGNIFTLVGKKYELFFDPRYKNLENSESAIINTKRSVDLFGKRESDSVLAFAVCSKQSSKKTYVGKLTEFDGGVVKAIVVDGEGKRAATRTLTAEILGETKIFEGKNPIGKDKIVPGRICALYGHYNPSTGIIDANTVVCDLDLATDGGRVVGVLEDNNPDELSILASVAPALPLSLDVKANIDTKIVHNGTILDGEEVSRIPVGTSVEVIGYFSSANSVIHATSIISKPYKPSDSIFGKLFDNGLVDYFGNTHEFNFDDLSNVTGVGGALEPERWVLAWISNGHVQSAYLPELGFMGVRISGYLKGVGSSNIELDCVSSMDYDLPGRTLDIGCGAYCRAIVGGIGIVRLSDIPVGSFLHCWGVPTLDGGFSAMLVNVQTIIE